LSPEAFVIGYAGIDTYDIILSNEYVRYKGITDPNWRGGPPVNVIISLRGNIGSTSSSSPAIITGDWPAGSVVTLSIPSGTIVAGAGGTGGGFASDRTAVAAVNGGDAISIATGAAQQYGGAYTFNVVNNGIIGGGGGGGGYGGILSVSFGGGGGGGAGIGAGAAGPLGRDSRGQGAPGTATTGGAGGVYPSNNYSGVGGNGGTLGAPGAMGRGSAPAYDGAPSLAGRAFKLNGRTVNITGTGTVYGTSS
jgi:hypothetical protein